MSVFRAGGVPRRLVFLALALAILGVVGFGLLAFRWSGRQGEPPSGQLYVLGEFAEERVLVRLHPRPEGRGDPGRACYDVEVPGVEGADARLPGEQPAALRRLCRGKPIRVWVDDALLAITVGARGVPRLSIAGLRVDSGDRIGSLADPDDDGRPHPRYPLRGYGIPGLAALRVDCEPVDVAGKPPAACIEVRDRLGRLAVVRAADGVEVVDRLQFGGRYRLFHHDVLWLGLVPFRVRIEQSGNQGPPTLELRRIDRVRARRAHAQTEKGTQTVDERDGRERVPERGGDRRWLGRLWPVEVPDPGEGARRFEVRSMKKRYTPHHLSRQRTNFEGEDVLQRLIDGQWLCLGKGMDGVGRIVWRPPYEPGCRSLGEPAELPFDEMQAPSPAALSDYFRARSGDLAFLTGTLIDATNAALSDESYLEDPTALPLTFDWHLALPAGTANGPQGLPQPVPEELWGARFGITRQARRSVADSHGQRPEIRPRASTARHLVQVLRGEKLLASFYLPHREAEARGAICLGRHTGDATPYRASSGGHHPLGSAAFAGDPNSGSWSEDPGAPCRGCLLSLTVTAGAGERSPLALALTGDCSDLKREGTDSDPAWLPEQVLSWRDLRLRHVRRSAPPWLVLTDPATGRRHFAEEFSVRGGLEPLLGDAAAFSGVEAALSEYLDDGAEISAPEFLELSIDGDLQLAATAIVHHLARDVLARQEAGTEQVPVTAVVLDAVDGEVLAVVNASSSGAARFHHGKEPPLSAWSLGSGQVKRAENAALLRRRALGSTMKITGGYALINNDLPSGPEITERRRGTAVRESPAPGGGGRIFLHHSSPRRRLRAGRRECSTGAHFLPAGDAGFTEGTLVRRFAQSCNNFFVLAGFRHAGSRPAALSEWRRRDGPAGADQEEPLAGRDELLIDARKADEVTLVQPAFETQPLVERIRDGLASDFRPGEPSIPRSLYGILFRLGFHPRPSLFARSGVAPAELAFEHRGQTVRIPLAHGWFTSPEASVPALRPGRDFAYPGIPSPTRLDETTFSTAASEWYDAERREVRRLTADGQWADVQYAMLLIGQSNVEISTLGLASLYAPVARRDGRAVRPCLFRDSCGDQRQGDQVIDPQRAAVLNLALRAVLSRGGTAYSGLRDLHLTWLRDNGWGGKTGTYEVGKGGWPRQLRQDDWQRLVAYACGVEGAKPPSPPAPTRSSEGREIAGLVSELIEGGWGGALGARSCEDPAWPLNPAGIQRYNGGDLPSRLDQLARTLREIRTTGRTRTFHSFVAVALPGRGEWPETPNPAEGIVVAVMVDRETPGDPQIAVKIGAELAAAVERWAGALTGKEQ